MNEVPYSYLIPACGISDDQRQDMYLALLENTPASETDAHRVLSRVRYAFEYTHRTERQRNLPLLCEPATPEPQAQSRVMTDALSALPDDAQDLIREHVINGTSLRAIAKAAGVSKDTIRKRYDLAKRKLASIAEKQ